MPKLQPSQHGPFTGGVNAAAGSDANPRGTVPRASNFLGIKRAALTTCNGSSILAWNNGVIQSHDGRFMALEVFQPSGVSPYYLALKQVSNVPIGPPLALAGTGGGHTYAVTALDGIGGESLPATVTSSGTITWTGIPNAFAYNIYRDGVLLTTGPGAAPCTSTTPGSILPIPQVCGNANLQFTYTDNSTAVPLSTLPIALAAIIPQQAGIIQFTVTSPATTANLPASQPFTLSGNVPDPTNPASLNGNYIVSSVVNSSTFNGLFLGPVSFLPLMGSGTGGTATFAVPVADTTEQTALFKIPASTTLAPETYTNNNIIALFPPPVQRLNVTGVAGQIQTGTSTGTGGGINVGIASINPLRSQLNTIFSNGDSTFTLDFGSGGPFRGQPIAPPAVQVGDFFTTTGDPSLATGNPWTVLSINTARSSITASPASGTPNPVTNPPLGYVAWQLVVITTNASYTAPNNSLQIIAGSPPVNVNGVLYTYNGTWRVRFGVTNGTQFIIVVTNFALLPVASGGTVSPDPPGSIPAMGGAATPVFVADPAPIAAPPSGLVPFPRPITTISVQQDQAGVTRVVVDTTPYQMPQGLQPGDHVSVSGVSHLPAFNGIYTIHAVAIRSIDFNEVPAGLSLGDIGGVGQITFEEVIVSLAGSSTLNIAPNSTVTIAGAANSSFNGVWTVRQGTGGSIPSIFLVQIPGSYAFGSSGGGTVTPGGGGGGGGGGGVPGPTGPPVSGVEAATINSGIVGLLSPVPQMAQFTNRMIMGLGNGYPPNYVPDGTGTPTNPAFESSASTIAVTGTTSAGVEITVTVSNPGGHGLTPGSSFALFNPASGFNAIGKVVTITGPPAGGCPTPGTTPTPVPPSVSFTAFLFTTSASIPTTGTVLQTASPLPNNYFVQFPIWNAQIYVTKGDLYVPKTQPTNTGGVPIAGCGVYLQCTQSGMTGTTEPHWPNPDKNGVANPDIFPIKNIVETPTAPGTGTPITTPPPGGAVWEEVGYLNSLNPPLPGAAHIAVYSSCLFAFNTYPFNTTGPAPSATGGPTVGTDGPTSLRQSDLNNPFSWNPANQAFLDKDDGSEGMGLGTFTIAAVGIPPQGALFAFKNYSTYEITGLFGAGIAISRIKTERGCTAPRTIRFVPDLLGVVRLTHLGVSVVDGVNDSLISDGIRPYLFVLNDLISSGIQFIDPVWQAFSYAALTANPPMYNMLIPLGQGGSSGGALTRSMSWDIMQKAWYPIDFPFSSSVISQALLTQVAPVTLLAGWNNGLIQRWQYGDQFWLVGSINPLPVAWSYRTPVTASQSPDQRLFVQEITIKGIDSNLVGPIVVTPQFDGIHYPPRQAALFQQHPGSGDFIAIASIMLTGVRFHADISGAGGVEIAADNFHMVPKPLAGRIIVA